VSRSRAEPATTETTDLVVRPLKPGETELFLSIPPDPALVGVQAFGRDYRVLLDRGEYRPEWTWVALRGDRVVARAAWWGAPDDEQPRALDWFDFGTDPEVGAAVLRAVPFTAEYVLLLPPDWRERDDARAAAEARIAAARRAGMRLLVERLHYRWTPTEGAPERPGRLVFRPAGDDAEVLELLGQIVEGSLDAHMRARGERDGAAAAARDELEFLHWMPSPRDWWRVAETPAGEVVGFVAPGRNYAGPIIGIVGVVPKQRGHGYAYDLLAEATQLLAAEGAEAIDADTDTTNIPMAATFARAGYPITQHRVTLEWPSAPS
jgi:RimJ/RimL family protein N-acetyltransferase